MSIRRSLLLALVALTLLTSGGILVVTILAGRRAVEDLSGRLIGKSAEQTRSELETFFGSVADHVRVARAWAACDCLDADKPLDLNSVFVPLLEANPQVSSMMVTESEGTGYLLLRQAIDRDEWLNRIVRVTPDGTTAHKRYWNARTGELREETVPMDYDPRTRVWYQGAMSTQPDVPGKDVHWTKPVIFFITKDPGITAGSHATDKQGRSIVVAFDLLLLDIARLTTKRVKPSENGTAFVLWEDTETDTLRVVGLPRDERYRDDQAIKEELIVVPQSQADAKANLPAAADFGVGPIGPALAAWRAGGAVPDRTFRFEHDGAWWAAMQPFDVGQNRFWIGVSVPETDFLAEVRHQRNRVIGIALGALLLSILLAFLLARGFSRPLEELVATSQRIRALDIEALPTTETHIEEVAALAESQRELVGALQSFVRYVPVDVVRELMRRGEVAQIGGSTRTLTILFTDIAGFTTISESMPPQALAEHMAEYFEVMLAELRKHEATVDKFVGDAIVAFWGAPRANEQHAPHAVQSTLACMRSLAEANRRWVAQGRPAMPTRFGLATGEVVVGNIGATSRLSYTVLGDRVNLAARLEALNKRYGTDTLVASSVVEAAGDGFVWRRVDRVAVKGKTEGVDVYELLGAEGTVDDGTLAFVRAYEAALDDFQQGRFEQASSQLEVLQRERPDDRSIQHLRAACARYIADPPPRDWDGTIQLNTK